MQPVKANSDIVVTLAGITIFPVKRDKKREKVIQKHLSAVIREIFCVHAGFFRKRNVFKAFLMRVRGIAAVS